MPTTRGVPPGRSTGMIGMPAKQNSLWAASAGSDLSIHFNQAGQLRSGLVHSLRRNRTGANAGHEAQAPAQAGAASALSLAGLTTPSRDASLVQRLSCYRMDRIAAGQLLPSACSHLCIARLDLHGSNAPADLFTGKDRRAGTDKGVENDRAALRHILQCISHELGPV